MRVKGEGRGRVWRAGVPRVSPRRGRNRLSPLVQRLKAGEGARGLFRGACSVGRHRRAGDFFGLRISGWTERPGRALLKGWAGGGGRLEGVRRGRARDAWFNQGGGVIQGRGAAGSNAPHSQDAVLVALVASQRLHRREGSPAAPAGRGPGRGRAPRVLHAAPLARQPTSRVRHPCAGVEASPRFLTR